ncbi:MAG TPA: flagellar protein FlbD [Elusimicrobia bacterium]|nr:flagellar protein FlbD [Elusimicrobiota bacterium]HBT60948.1 flagellar protein FlbD [Elusimicrobiota bacterium]
MIKVHKLNGSEVIINAELIESLEPGQETVVTLATGNRFLVRESADEVTQKVLEYRRQISASGKVVNPISGYTRE